MFHSNLAAILPGPGKPLEITTRPIPAPKAGEILIRNHAVACNPSDYKIQQKGVFIKSWPAVVGQDVAGTVETVGPDVSRFKPGDRVCGWAAAVMNSNPDHGAWQTYTVLEDSAATHIPDHILFTDAAVIPAGGITAATGLITALGISPRLEKRDTAILIWGASSSVGSAAVQIARALGFTVYATAGSRHHGWLKDLGVSKMFDYQDPDVTSKILSAAAADNLTLNLSFDVIGGRQSLQQSAEIVSSFGGKVATTVKWLDDQVFPANVEVAMTITMHSRSVHANVGKWFFTEWLEEALQSGTYKPAPKSRVVPGGIAAAQTVFDIMGQGVSGEKLVVEVKEE